MYPVEDADSPTLPTYLCYQCGFHPNTVLMEDKVLYLAYQEFFARFKDTLKPNVTRRRDRTLSVPRNRYIQR